MTWKDRVRKVRTAPGRAWERIRAVRLPQLEIEQEQGSRQISQTREFFHNKLGSNPVFNYYLILIITIILLCIGLTMVFSAQSVMEIHRGNNPYWAFVKPLGIALVALFLMWLAQWLPPTGILRFAPGILAVTAFLQLLVFTQLGREVKGNRNWIAIPGFGTFQPSELLKIGVILYVAWAIHTGRAKMDDYRSILKWFLPVFGALALVILGGDMGTLIIFILFILVMLWIGGIKPRYLQVTILVGMVAGGILIGISNSRRTRVLTFVRRLLGIEHADPGADFQLIRAKWGLGTGGLTGLGPGASRQKWNYLPEAHTDFIFAILGEEFGLIGTLTVVVLFVALAYALMRVIRSHPARPAVLVCTGVWAWLIGQAFINILVVIGLAPVLGVPLPLISSGGSSMLATLGGIGLALGWARETPAARAYFEARPRTGRKVFATLSQRVKPGPKTPPATAPDGPGHRSRPPRPTPRQTGPRQATARPTTARQTSPVTAAQPQSQKRARRLMDRFTTRRGKKPNG